MWNPVIYQKMSFGYMMWKTYAVEPRWHDHPLDGTELVVLAAPWWSH